MSQIKSNTKLALLLRSIAAITSGTSAVAAYPAAANMLGQTAGAVIVSASATAIFAGWHYVGSESGTDRTLLIKKSVAGSVAVIFAAAMIGGIHASAQQKTTADAKTEAKQADSLYLKQEASRIETLSLLTKELRATSKRNNPEEYKKLQAQIDRSSQPTPRVNTKSEELTQATTSAYSWAVAATFEVVTPALLILAGLFSRKTREQPQQPSAVNTVDAQLSQGTQVVDSIELTQLSPATTPTTTPTTEVVNAQQLQQLIANRELLPNADGHVTAAAAQELTGCTQRKARTALTTAVNNGYLIKTGTGGATRYSYPPAQLRRVK